MLHFVSRIIVYSQICSSAANNNDNDSIPKMCHTNKVLYCHKKMLINKTNNICSCSENKMMAGYKKACTPGV